MKFLLYLVQGINFIDLGRRYIQLQENYSKTTPRYKI